jgi:hypothetical protein
MRVEEYTNRVRILEFHDEMVRVRLVDEDGQQLAGGLDIDVPREIIPIPLRRYGQVFRLRRRSTWPEGQDSAETLREQARDAFEYLGE